MGQSLTNSGVSYYQQACQRIIGGNRNESCEPKLKSMYQEVERLNFRDIQNITKSMMKDRKAHEQNLGVLQNIKGKMYCLKLGEVSNFKQFSHFFYASQYRRRQQKAGPQLNGRYPMNTQEIKRYPSFTTKEIKNPMQNLPGISSKQLKTQHEIILRLQQDINNQQQVTNWQEIQIDEKLKQKVDKYMFPTLPGTSSSNKAQNKQNKDEGQWRKKRQSRGFSVTRML